LTASKNIGYVFIILLWHILSITYRYLVDMGGIMLVVKQC